MVEGGLLMDQDRKRVRPSELGPPIVRGGKPKGWLNSPQGTTWSRARAEAFGVAAPRYFKRQGEKAPKR